MNVQDATTANGEITGKLTGTSRRSFIKGIAAAGASTAAAVALDAAGVADVFGDPAYAAGDATDFSNFKAIAASTNDALEVPEGFRADELIRFGDVFSDDQGNEYEFGYNNDFLAYFPLDGSKEGLLFVNHEYPSPFFQHGYKPSNVANGSHSKTAEQIQDEQDAVGNSFLHIKRDDDGVWQVVSPSPYNRRVYGDRPALPFTGPLAGTAGIGASAHGTVGNCSGGITPWDTALSCEENYDGYGIDIGASDFAYGWSQVGDDTNSPDEEFLASTKPAKNPNGYKKHGWVVEHDPYDPGFAAKKHTALGRFRHENTAFRQAPGKKFVLYMGDDANNQGVYKFVSDRAFIAGNRSHNLQILQEGTLYIAKWLPEGRRRFAVRGDVTPISAESGTGEWVALTDQELADTRLYLGGFLTDDDSARRAKQGSAAGDTDPADAGYAGRFNRDVVVPVGQPGAGTTVNEWDRYFATNRPEDVEVSPDGKVWIALTNNTSSGVNDAHGAIRVLSENANDPEATTFTWEDFVGGGGPKTADPGTEGFSAADNLVFDKDNNLWVVTDISTSSTKSSTNPRPEYLYHGNNAVFMIPTSGANERVAFRFANSPIEAELTGPYFTPDEQTLFLAVQHPGEESQNQAASIFGQPETYRSWWPDGNKTANQNPSTPQPTVVTITRVKKKSEDKGTNVIPPPAAGGGQGGPPPVAPPPGRPADRTAPRVEIDDLDPRESMRTLLARGLKLKVTVDEACTVLLVLRADIPSARRRRRRGAKSAEAAQARTRTITIARVTRKVNGPGTYSVTLKPSVRTRASLRRSKVRRLAAKLTLRTTDLGGNARSVGRRVTFR